MRIVNTKLVIPLVTVIALSLAPGCTDYKKKYDYKEVEFQNLKGRYETLEGERADLANRVAVFVCSQPGAVPRLPEDLRKDFETHKSGKG